MRRKKKENKSHTHGKNTRTVKVKIESKNGFKRFLEQNKIYFETFMALIVSIAGIVVSVVGVMVAITANNISLQEQRIQDLEKQPSFVLETETDEMETKYIIKNTGGDIKSGDVFGEKVFVVTVHNENYDYVGKGYIILNGYMDPHYSKYDFSTKSFELRSEIKSRPVLTWINKVEDIIQSEGFYCGIECTEYFDFLYTDYKQEQMQRDMIVRGGLICDVENNGNYEFKMYVDFENLDDEQLSADIRKELDLLIKYNSN